MRPPGPGGGGAFGVRVQGMPRARSGGAADGAAVDAGAAPRRPLWPNAVADGAAAPVAADAALVDAADAVDHDAPVPGAAVCARAVPALASTPADAVDDPEVDDCAGASDQPDGADAVEVEVEAAAAAAAAPAPSARSGACARAAAVCAVPQYGQNATGRGIPRAQASLIQR